MPGEYETYFKIYFIESDSQTIIDSISIFLAETFEETQAHFNVSKINTWENDNTFLIILSGCYHYETGFEFHETIDQDRIYIFSINSNSISIYDTILNHGSSFVVNDAENIILTNGNFIEMTYDLDGYWGTKNVYLGKYDLINSDMDDLYFSTGTCSGWQGQSSWQQYPFLKAFITDEDDYFDIGYVYRAYILSNIGITFDEIICMDQNFENTLWNRQNSFIQNNQILSTKESRLNTILGEDKLIIFGQITYGTSYIEVLNLYTGNTLHNQTINITPDFIGKNNNGKIYFFDTISYPSLCHVYEIADSSYVEADDNIIQKKFNMLHNYPNPFNPSTTIEFSLQIDSSVELSIYNVKGQKVKTLVEYDLQKGSHSIIWNGVDKFGDPVSSGIYFYSFEVNGEAVNMKKCIL